MCHSQSLCKSSAIFKATWENWNGTSKAIDLENSIIYLKLWANRSQLQVLSKIFIIKHKGLAQSHRELISAGPFSDTYGGIISHFNTLIILSNTPSPVFSKELGHLCKAHSH